MGIHQIQVRYDAIADRLLVQLRTTNAEVYAVWLTRRLASRLYLPYREAVARLGLAHASPQALAVPEARQMLEEAALQRPLPGTDFQKPFAEEDSSHPLGREPLLAVLAELTPGADGQIALSLHEHRGRRLDLKLGDELATALLRLMDQALLAAEWNLPGSAAALAEPEALPARVLN
jgi:hypothetical protein